MYEKEPQPSERHFSFEEIATLFRECDRASMPYSQAAFLLSAAESPRNRVEDGVLYAPGGHSFKLATEEELNDLREIKEEAEINLMNKLGIEDRSMLPALTHVVDGLKTQGAKRKAGISRNSDEILSRLGVSRLTVPEFFEAARTLAGLTGESYQAWGNMYQTHAVEISAETDIDSLIAEGLQSDKQMVSHMQSSPHLSEEFKEQFTLENVHEAYGVDPVASES